jgi:DNA-binding response OmpR family regulator
MAGPSRKTIGVFNASEDTVEMLIEALTLRGHHAVGGAVDHVKSGQTDLIAFLETHRPDAMIWDISPPYDRNWTFTKLVRAVLTVYRCSLVLTTTNTQQLDKAIGNDSGAIEIVGKPYDIEAIADRVDAVMRRASDIGPRAVDRHTEER